MVSTSFFTLALSVSLEGCSTRPKPNPYTSKYQFNLHEEVDAYEIEGWWVRVVTKVLDNHDKLQPHSNSEITNGLKLPRTPGYMVPIFTSDEVYGKVEKLQDKVLKISKMPKPKPKVEIPPKIDSVKAENQEEATSTSSNNTDNEAAGEKIHEPEGQSQGSNGEQDANEEHFDEA